VHTPTQGLACLGLHSVRGSTGFTHLGFFVKRKEEDGQLAHLGTSSSEKNTIKGTSMIRMG